jgi:nucleoside-diphosphate-sugar epimerase
MVGAMRCLVLGGSVFVGKHLVELLVAEGHDVAVLNRGRTPSSLPDGVQQLIADRTDLAQLRSALDGRDWDAVFDVSGFVMAAGGSDIDGLLDLLEGHVGGYVYVSSIMAYDQSSVGVFPWNEHLPTNPDGSGSYGGFKALSEASMVARHATSGFPASIVRPAAIYGPDNNIFDMETPMFLRLLERRPILVPHGGLVVGSYGHVDDLCGAMLALSQLPAAHGQVFNVTGESLDVNRYVSLLADVVGAEPDLVRVPDELLGEIGASGRPPVYGHLFKVRHHAMLSTEKVRSVLGPAGFADRYDLRTGHEQTYRWFLQQGWTDLDVPLVDPVWRASWDFDAETALAERIRRG